MSLELDTVYCGDCLGLLKTFPDESIDCCVTSPPYYGLRDYGVSGQIGLESSPEEYVTKLVEVFREVKRVLKPSGTLWLNLGDSYCSQGGERKYGSYDNETGRSDAHGKRLNTVGLKPKDLIGVPWRVAFALQSDGWWLRQDIIWAKNNPMPESVTDRCTKSHEYIFLLTKSARYYYDAEAVKEEATGYDGRKDTRMKGSEKYQSGNHFGNNPNTLAVNGCERWPSQINGVPARNRRSVWTINTKPFKGAHFAVMPEALVEPCILAGTSEKGVCPACGKAWTRQLEKKPMVIRKTDRMADMGEFGRYQSSGTMLSPAESKTIGWTPSCSCNLPPKPAVVIDPFSGAGTTGVVAKRLGRAYVGIELNPEYCEIARKRIAAVPARLDRWGAL